uniref:tripartite motif-containing protein 16-like isoform X3 n=1 Tax=Myxine glutinosa TaxID=7769 RepID=UPI00358E0CB6
MATDITDFNKEIGEEEEEEDDSECVCTFHSEPFLSVCLVHWRLICSKCPCAHATRPRLLPVLDAYADVHRTMYEHAQHVSQKRKEGEARIKILLKAANDAEAVEKEYGSLNPVLWEFLEEKRDRLMKTKEEEWNRGGSPSTQDTQPSLLPPRLDETRARELERFGQLRVAIFSSLTPPCSRDSSPPLMDYACSPIFNKDTAHPQLRLSDDLREVMCTKRKHPYPESPQRFDHWEQVLCKEEYHTGRHYWEVWVTGSQYWRIGVTGIGLARHGLSPQVALGRNAGSWCLRRSRERLSIWHNGVSVPISSLSGPLERIGIWLDLDEPELTFWDARLHVPLYSFRPLKPGHIPQADSRLQKLADRNAAIRRLSSMDSLQGIDASSTGSQVDSTPAEDKKENSKAAGRFVGQTLSEFLPLAPAVRMSCYYATTRLMIARLPEPGLGNTSEQADAEGIL